MPFYCITEAEYRFCGGRSPRCFVIRGGSCNWSNSAEIKLSPPKDLMLFVEVVIFICKDICTKLVKIFELEKPFNLWF